MSDLILCLCGCDESFTKKDSKGRLRKYIQGHNSRANASQKIANYRWPSYKICTMCKKEFPIDFFRKKLYHSKITSEAYRRPYHICNCCEKDYAKTKLKEYQRQYKKAYDENHRTEIKFHVQNRITQWKKKSDILSNLTVKYLVDLYHLQKGLCYYSGESLIIGSKGVVTHSISLDRLDPLKGYVQGNVVWCLYLVNTMKQRMTELEFYDFLNIILFKANQR